MLMEPTLVEAILDEANIAFELNTGLFTALKAPNQLPPLISPATVPVLGDPTTPTIESSDATKEESKVVFSAEKSEGSYSIAGG